MNFFNADNKFIQKTSSNNTQKRKLQYEKKKITLDAYHKEQLKRYINNNIKKQDIIYKPHNFNFKYTILYKIAKNKEQAQIKQQHHYKQKKNDDYIKEEEINYFMNIGDILYNYYDMNNNVKKKISKIPSFNLSILMNENNLNNINNNQNNKNLLFNDNSNTKLSLYDEYLSKCDKNYINKEIKFQNICSNCNSTNIILNDNSISYCDDCSCINSITIETDKPSYKEPQKEISYLNYKRKNHLNEYLNQIQGKEITDIPQDIFNKITYELRKLKILDVNNNVINGSYIKYEILKEILKKIKLNKYYEHIPYIHYRITGISQSSIPNELIDKIKNMFELIQNPFYKYCPDSRKSFLSYSYCIHKMLQILEEYQYLKYFPLLKNREKLYLHEKIWENICNDLNWEFKPSM